MNKEKLLRTLKQTCLSSGLIENQDTFETDKGLYRFRFTSNTLKIERRQGTKWICQRLEPWKDLTLADLRERIWVYRALERRATNEDKVVV